MRLPFMWEAHLAGKVLPKDPSMGMEKRPVWRKAKGIYLCPLVFFSWFYVVISNHLKRFFSGR